MPGSLSRRGRPSRSAAAAASSSAEVEFDSLVKHCNQRVYRLALRVTRNHQDAEDARQETFLKAYRHLDQFEGRKVQVIGLETTLINWKNPVIDVQQVQPMW